MIFSFRFTEVMRREYSCTRKPQAACQFAIFGASPALPGLVRQRHFEPVRNLVHPGHAAKGQFFTYGRSQQTRNQRSKAMLADGMSAAAKINPK